MRVPFHMCVQDKATASPNLPAPLLLFASVRPKRATNEDNKNRLRLVKFNKKTEIMSHLKAGHFPLNLCRDSQTRIRQKFSPLVGGTDLNSPGWGIWWDWTSCPRCRSWGSRGWSRVGLRSAGPCCRAARSSSSRSTQTRPRAQPSRWSTNQISDVNGRKSMSPQPSMLW